MEEKRILRKKLRKKMVINDCLRWYSGSGEKKRIDEIKRK